MHGKLNFNNISRDIFNLNLQDLITQLKDIDKIDFTEADKTNKNYMDILVNIFNEAKVDSRLPGNEEIEVLLPIFIKKLKELTQDSEKLEKLKKLGATDLDVAFINNDSEVIKKIINNNEETNIYDLAKKFRFLDFAMNQNNFDYTLTLKIDEKDIYLPLLFNNIFVETTNVNKKNLAFIIQDEGHKTWDYNYSGYEYKNLRPLFNQLITYGTGSKYLFPKHISEVLQEQAENIQKQNLDFAFVVIKFHDSKEGGHLRKVISEFPDNLAKETLYVIRSCYSGQYHEIWKKENKSAVLITTASKDETSLITSFNCMKLNDFFVKNDMSIEKFIEFFSEYYGSTPYISGKYNDKLINYMSVKGFHEQLVNGESKPYAELAETTAGIENLEIDLTGATLDHLVLHPNFAG